MYRFILLTTLLLTSTLFAKPSTYTVFGQEYQVISNPEHYQETGLCSWYGGQFHGKKTANGEIFDMNKISAAHKTLPLGSVVEITNLDNQKTLVVTINDRGPFVKGRIIDVSFAGAKKLGMVGKGTAHVSIRYIGSIRPKKPHSLQIGAFRSAQHAAIQRHFIRSKLSQKIPAQFGIHKRGKYFTLVIEPSDHKTLKFLKDKLKHLEVEFFELKS